MKWKAMKKSIPFLVLSGVCLTGCGGGGGAETVTSGTAPAIASLQYTPGSITANALTDVTWQFDYSDPDGDVKTGTYTVFNPSGAQVYSQTISLATPSGSQSATLHGTTYGVRFLSAGTYTAKMYVTDSAGSDSNTLTATFTIVQ